MPKDSQTRAGDLSLSWIIPRARGLPCRHTGDLLGSTCGTLARSHAITAYEWCSPVYRSEGVSTNPGELRALATSMCLRRREMRKAMVLCLVAVVLTSCRSDGSTAPRVAPSPDVVYSNGPRAPMKTDTAEFRIVRERLAAQRRTSPLFDTTLTRAERIAKTKAWLESLPPDQRPVILGTEFGNP